ncbi:MAG: ABC transporter permease [Rhodothermales bacterium]|nr:ABC transporter permease [Rhodothermales bacterium]
MKSINRKLYRNLWHMRGQALAIAFVVVAGVSTYVSFQAVMDSLQRTLDSYYASYEFADVFATVRRAPQRLEDRIQGVPGVARVQNRVLSGLNLEIEGFEDAITGQVVSIPEGRQPLLNQVYLREGRLLRPGREDEVILNEVFSQAHDLSPGDSLTAVMNGRRKTLHVVGIGLSPEFLIQLEPGTMFPDAERFGVLWMGRDAVAAAYDMEGAFNNVSLALAPGANVDDVIDRLDLILKPWGGAGAQSRDRQLSHFYITEDFKQLETTSTVMPLVFLAVAAFLLNIVVTRLIRTQKEEIAVLKAFGYGNGAVGWHYVKFTMVIAAVGAAAGTGLGIWMGAGLGNLYLEFYRFPELDYAFRPRVALSVAALTTAMILIGVVSAVRKAVTLPPAEAMRPSPPERYTRSLLERLGMQRFFDQPTRMIVRHVERQPVKSLLTVVGIAFSCSILILGRFSEESFKHIVDVQFGIVQQEDLMVSFIQPASTDAIYEIAAIPGVRHVEPMRGAPVRLRNGHRMYETGIEGVDRDGTLRNLVDTDLVPIRIPSGGILLSDRLAYNLDARPGDMLTAEFLEGARRIVDVPVVGVAKQYWGVSSYMDIDALGTLSGEPRAVSGALLTIDADREPDIVRELRRRSLVAGVAAQARVIESFWESSAQTMLTFTFILTILAGVIAFGVVYNSARIALSERDRELASLRVLGFTRGEIVYILLGEMALLTLVAIPVGFLIGSGMGYLIVGQLQTDLYSIPLILKRQTFAFAAVVVLASSAISGLIVRRKLHRLDLIGVLKTRE